MEWPERTSWKWLESSPDPALNFQMLRRFYTGELPKRIADREPPHITAEELVQVVKP